MDRGLKLLCHWIVNTSEAMMELLSTDFNVIKLTFHYTRHLPKLSL